MENASKALIIAGAILISIVLVSVGVIVVQSLNPDEALSAMSQQEIDSFNSKFTSNAGNNRQGTIARSVISAAITSNSQYMDEESRQVKITTVGLTPSTANVTEITDPNELTPVRNAINSSSRYDIGYTINTKTGLVDVITITKK